MGVVRVVDAGCQCWARDIFAIERRSRAAGTTGVADRDAIVERRKESIGVSVKKGEYMRLAHMGYDYDKDEAATGSGDSTHSFPST